MINGHTTLAPCHQVNSGYYCESTADRRTIIPDWSGAIALKADAVAVRSGMDKRQSVAAVLRRRIGESRPEIILYRPEVNRSEKHINKIPKIPFINNNSICQMKGYGGNLGEDDIEAQNKMEHTGELFPF